MRRDVMLICDECLARNYKTSKNVYSQKRLELKKFCSNCKCYTIHKESR